MILKINLKYGKKIINVDLYSNDWVEAGKKMASQFRLDEKYSRVIFQKVNKALSVSKDIFNCSMDSYTYKQISDLIEINEIRNNIDYYIPNKKKSKSVKCKTLINRYKDNDIMLNLCDIKKTANLNNSF